jgi:hypothetical protein
MGKQEQFALENPGQNRTQVVRTLMEKKHIDHVIAEV